LQILKNAFHAVSSAMKVSDFLAAADVAADVVAADKQKLLEIFARKAGSAVNVAPDVILAELRKREALGSTGVGGGVAIPHARFVQIHKPFGMLMRLRKPIDFDAVDGGPVDTVFLLLLPQGSAGEQLGALASITRKLRDAATIAEVRRAADGAQIYRILAAD
jgi:nitrogen PTS system EIIA component